MSHILPEQIISTLGSGNVRGFCDANSSCVNLYCLLDELCHTTDLKTINHSIPLLKQRFFAVDADEPVSLGSQLNVQHTLDKLERDGGVTQLPCDVLVRLHGATLRKLEALVTQYQVGSMQITVHLEGQDVQVAVNRDATMLQLLQTLGRKVGRDLTSDYVFVRKCSGISRRRGTVLMAEEPLPMTQTLREASVVEDEVILCTKSKGASERALARVRITVPLQNKWVEMSVTEGLLVSAAVQSVLGPSVAGVLVMFRPGNTESRSYVVLDPVRSLASYQIKTGHQQLVCCSAADWEQGSDDYGSSNGIRSWVALICDWDGLKSVRTPVMKAKLRNGLPSWTRESVWALLLNAYAARAEQPGLYASLVVEAPPSRASGRWESDRQVVFRDVARTFPQHPFYFTGANGTPGVGLKPLQNILLAWHSMEPRIGYCQGINFVAAVFLLQMEEELAFWCLHSLLTVHGLENLYKTGLPLLQECLDIFQQLVERWLPKLAEFFALHGVPMSSFATPWFHTLFTSKFPLSLVCRLMDMFLREGFCVIFRMGLAILKEKQSEILALDPDDLFMYLQDADKLLHGLSEEEWMTRCLKITKTKEMHVSLFTSFDHMRTRPLSVPIAPMLKKVGTMFRELGTSVKSGKSPRSALSGVLPSVSPSRQSLNANQTPPNSTRFEDVDPVDPQRASDMASIWLTPDEGVLLLEGNEVVAGTPEKLVERLTAPKFPGQLYTDAFLLTYRTFLMPLRLMQLLRARLEYIPRPAQPKESALGKSAPTLDFAQDVVQPIRLRVFTCLRLWIAAYPRDFDDVAVQHEFDMILNLFRAASLQNMVDRLQRGMQSRPAPVRPMHPPSLTLPPLEEREKRLQGLFEKASPVQMAKLLCILDRKAYSSCQPHHLMESGPSVQAVLRWNAKLSTWVEGAVVHQPTLELVVARFQYFVEVADACLSMNDVSSMMTVGLALRWIATTCFPKAFLLLKRCRLASQQKWAFLSSIMEKDFSSLTDARFFLDRYRGTSAAIPWINCFVDAARTIWSEMPDTVSLDPNRPNAVNFQKRLLMWQIVESFLLFQRSDYDSSAPASFTACDLEGWTVSQLSDIIWGTDEISKEALCEEASKLSQLALKWTSTAKGASGGSASSSPVGSPRGGAGSTAVVVGPTGSPRASPRDDRAKQLLGSGRRRKATKADEEGE